MKKGIILPIYKGDNKIKKKTPLIASDWYSYYLLIKSVRKNTAVYNIRCYNQ